MAAHAPSHPEEFRYWANVERPGVRALRALGRTVLGFDLAPSDDVVRAFAASYYDADPVADAFVDDVYSKQGGRCELPQRLGRGLGRVPHP